MQPVLRRPVDIPVELSKMGENGSHLIQKGHDLLRLVSIARAQCLRRIGSMNIDYIQRSG